MVASGGVVVIDMALLPLFCIVGLATWEMANSATEEVARTLWVAMALMVAGEVTEKEAL